MRIACSLQLYVLVIVVCPSPVGTGMSSDTRTGLARLIRVGCWSYGRPARFGIGKGNVDAIYDRRNEGVQVVHTNIINLKFKFLGDELIEHRRYRLQKALWLFRKCM